MRRNRFHIAGAVILAVWHNSLPAAEVDTALIESVVLVNFDTLSGDRTEMLTQRARRADVSTALIDAALPDGAAYSNAATLEATFGALLQGHTDAEIATAVQYAFNYTLNTGIGTFGLDLAAATNALELFVKTAFEASDQRDINNGEDTPNPKKLAESLARSVLTDFVLNWAIANNQHVPTSARDVAKAIGRGALSATTNNSNATEIAETLTNELTGGAMDLLETATTDGVTFHKGIVPVTEGVDDATMLYDGAFEKFHPDKARIIEYVVNGSTYGIMETLVTNTSVDLGALSQAIGAKAAEAAVTKFNSLTGDNSLFLYETIKAIGYGTSMGSVLVTGSVSNSKALTNSVAENLSYGVASGAIEKVLNFSYVNNLTDPLKKPGFLSKVGEAAAYGTAMGTGFAGSMLKDFDRAELAQYSAQGAAKGAMIKAADKKGNTEAENDELLNLARGTAMGSVLGSVAMAHYNHLNAYEVDVQKVIELAAQGTAFGNMTADLVADDGTARDKLPGHKEDFEVEIARAVANGASTGALFEITSLMQTQPDVRTADINSIKTAKSVSYGATKGAILGGDASGVSSDVSVKQAAEQGLTEGSLDGVALALGFAENKVNEASIRSETAIKNAIGVGNKDASVDAAKSLAIKAINPTIEDMRQLMKLYGIDPKLTNPGFVFPNPKRSGEENFLFPADEIPIVSPI